jgi:hypothetical protein
MCVCIPEGAEPVLGAGPTFSDLLTQNQAAILAPDMQPGTHEG